MKTEQYLITVWQVLPGGAWRVTVAPPEGPLIINEETYAFAIDAAMRAGPMIKCRQMQTVLETKATTPGDTKE